MEINPEDVKAEIAAVKVAFAQVNARLGRGRAKTGGSRPDILSRVSKAVAPETGDHGQQPVKSYADYDRRSSRRFVNRDWNIARKRTAEGLFVDDQEGVEGEDMDMQSPRKRSHNDGPSLPPSERQPAIVGEGTSFQPVRRGHQVLYDPFSEANKTSGHMMRPPQAGAASTWQPGDEASARTGRGFDQSRISLASASQQSDHRQKSSPRRPMRERRPLASQHAPNIGQKRRADSDGRGEAKVGRHDHTANDRQVSMPMEDGEVVALPPAPLSPKEEFIVEKRPERQAPVPDKVLQRNRRMFGALLGHLDGAERQEKKFEQSAVMKRRKELEEHAEERARKDSMQAREAERRRRFEARRKDIATKRELLLQQNMKQAKLLCAEKIAYARGLLQFIRTETIPPILWEPAGMNRDVEKLFEQQAQDFQSWAAEQLDKLRLDQQGMRERAEKQWAEIDRIREERHNANMGRSKPGAGPAKIAPKAVRSSVMTAKDYRDRAQQSRVPDAAEAEVPGQDAQDDAQDHAADEAEAHDETYLIPDADKAASGATDAEPSRSEHSATPERHAGAGGVGGSDDEADSKGEADRDNVAPKRNSSGQEADGAREEARSKAGINGASEDNVQAGDASDDSLSLSE